MYGFQGFDKLEETVPEFDDIPSTTRRPLCLEIFLKRALVGKFKKDIVVVSMCVTAKEPYDAL